MKENSQNKIFTRRQESALTALLSARSVADAARLSGVPESTLWRWLQDPEFQTRYRALRRQQVEHGICELQQLFSEAVDCLRRNLMSGQPSSECRAALGIITKSLEGVDSVDFDERITKLEELNTNASGKVG